MTTLIDKIRTYLQDNFPASKDVRGVSTALGVNPNTVRGILPRLVKSGDAERTSTGWYKAKKPRKLPEAVAGDAGPMRHGHNSIQG